MAVIVQGAISLICAIISGIILWKFQENNRKQDARHMELIEAQIAERELLHAIAEVTELHARKIDGEGINGELHKANEEIKSKRDDLRKIIEKRYFENLT